MENHLKICISLLLTLTWWPCGTTAHIRGPAAVQGDDFDSPIARQVMRLAKSAEIRNYMNPAVNACDDFYTYSCGNWGEINHNYDKKQRDLLNTLLQTYKRKVTKFLVSGTESSETELVRKVKYFYESCLQRDNIKRNKRQRLLSIMEEFGGMPALKGADWDVESFDWLQVIAKILRKYGKSIVIGVAVEPDFSNTTVNRLYIGEAEGMTSSRDIQHFEYLTDLWKVQLENVLGLPSLEASIAAHEMTKFHQELSRGVNHPFMDLGMHDKSKLSSLSAMTEKYGPTLNFTYFVKSWLGYDYQLPVYEYVADYIRNLKKIIPGTPTRTLANYIMWMLVQDFDFEVNDDEEEHKEICVEETQKHFFKYIDHLMYKDMEKFHQRTIDDAQSMFQHLKLTLADILNSPSMSWMAESTRDKALEKLSAVKFEINGYVNINFTQELGPLTMSSGDYFGNVVSLSKLSGENFRAKLNKLSRFEDTTMRVFSPMYIVEFNSIYIPLYFLQRLHFWENAYPKALQYGIAGFIIGHELMHAFDDYSRKYDAQGNFNNWWDHNSSAIFETRRECLRQQYGTFQHGSSYLSKNHNQGENIADVSGLRIAYKAYDEWLSNHHQTPEHLPHMDTITAHQLFFISAAQVWCAVIDKDWDSADIHSPEAVRVIGMMSNSDDFAKAFECEVGSPMNPRKKCVIY